MSSSLPPDESAAINAAGVQFDVDPRLITAVYGKESSYGTDPSGIGQSDPFHAFGLIAGPGQYNGYGYRAQGNTFEDAANTVAAFVAYERTQYDLQHPSEPFLQYEDNIYSPPADGNAKSYGNLVSIYQSEGGDPSGEAYYSSAQPSTPAPTGSAPPAGGFDPFAPLTQLENSSDPFGTIANAINGFNLTAQDIAVGVGFAAIGLALVAAGGVILAGGPAAAGRDASHVAEGAALAA